MTSLKAVIPARRREGVKTVFPPKFGNKFPDFQRNFPDHLIGNRW